MERIPFPRPRQTGRPPPSPSNSVRRPPAWPSECITRIASAHKYDTDCAFASRMSVPPVMPDTPWARAAIPLGPWAPRVLLGRRRPSSRHRCLSRLLVKKVVDLARGLRADAGHLGEIGGSGALDRLERSEMVQQRALARRADAGNFLQPGLADVAPPPHPMGAHGEAMRLVAQALDEIEHRLARLELERLAPRQEEGLEPGVAVRSLGDGDERHVGDAERRQRLLRRRELAASAIDDDEIGPGRKVLALGVFGGR